MNKYYVEKFNASDDSYRITEIFSKSGKFIEKGSIIFTIESSKADIDVESSENGYLYFNCFKGETIKVGDLFYIISSVELEETKKIFEIPKNIKLEGISISKKANYLLEKYNISKDQINKKLIKESDVLEFINKNKIVIDTNLINHKTNKTPLIIIGAKGGAKMCIDTLRSSENYEVVGLLDDNIEIGTNVLNIPVIGKVNGINKLLDLNINNFVIAFGVIENRKNRYELYQYLKNLGCKFPNIIHKSAIIEDSVQLGEGNVVLAGANIGSCVEIGNLNYINNNALISHDCILNDNIHIAPAAVLASSINIESHVLIGMNTTLFYGIKISESSTILNGLTINNNIDKNIIQKINN